MHGHLFFELHPLTTNLALFKASQDSRDMEEKRWLHRISSIVPRGLNLLH